VLRKALILGIGILSLYCHILMKHILTIKREYYFLIYILRAFDGFLINDCRVTCQCSARVLLDFGW
jgi:hypothetical protein